MIVKTDCETNGHYTALITGDPAAEAGTGDAAAVAVGIDTTDAAAAAETEEDREAERGGGEVGAEDGPEVAVGPGQGPRTERRTIESLRRKRRKLRRIKMVGQKKLQ